MFWGLAMLSGKKYTQTIEESFHISQAVLDVNSVENGSNPVQVILEYEGSDYILATLSKSAKIYQTPLDLNFQQGDKVSFRTHGPGRVYLSGYHVPEEDELESRLMNEDDSDMDDEEVETEQEMTLPPSAKRKKRPSDSIVTTSKKTKVDDTVEEEPSDEDEDDGEDDDETMGSSFINSLLDEEDGDESDEDDDDSGDEDDDSDEDEEDEKESPTPKKINGDVTPAKKEKLAKAEKQKTPVSAQKEGAKTPKTPKEGAKTPKTPKEEKTIKAERKTPKSEGKTPSEGNKTPNATASSPKKVVLEGGVIAEELKSGDGPVAKVGRTVLVYYSGRLKSNNKQFDATTSGPGFRFKLGRGEVIKGWDIGVSGMKVGGKRRLTIPAGLAYGAKGSPPVIPPNSTLIFEVELRGMS